MTIQRVWLITGASSGFGKFLTELALTKGDIVVATLRKPEMLQELSARYSKDRLLVLKLDVVNQANIDHAFSRTKEVFGRLDVVFNNAGNCMFGDAETTPIDMARALFEVNFWGAVNVSRAAIKFFREENEPERGGVLLQNTSIAVARTYAGTAFYSASKRGETNLTSGGLVTHYTECDLALDGFSEGLAMEIPPKWNIKICIIEPGAFNTNAVSNAVIFPVNPMYTENETSELVVHQRVLRDPRLIRPGDPAKLVKVIYSLVEDGNLPLRLPVGQDALAIAEKRVKTLEKEISEAAPWSVDLEMTS